MDKEMELLRKAVVTLLGCRIGSLSIDIKGLTNERLKVAAEELLDILSKLQKELMELDKKKEEDNVKATVS